ncbi:MAG: sigma-70 family RNA polymerase sigma factor [Oscillospiraceae bacterium]|nr:sigma-70 family RNA polymerase sigma factor [Oscillospiraceae bacterium]
MSIIYSSLAEQGAPIKLTAHSDRRTQFEETYTAYRALMFRLARNILQDDDLAEDAAADAAMKLWKHYDCLESPTGPQAKRFVAVLTEHRALDLLRKRKRERIVSLEEAEELHAPVGDPDGQMDVNAALNKLPNEQRTAVQLALVCGLTAKQIAETMGCTVSKAEKLVSRGKAALRKELEEGYHDR